jgi:beta-lactamase class A
MNAELAPGIHLALSVRLTSSMSSKAQSASSTKENPTSGLFQQIAEIHERSGAKAIALAYYDYASEAGLGIHADRWFHAASTIKVPILIALFGAIEKGRFKLDDRLHVRNRFYSVVDKEPFKVSTARDANAAVHRALGKTMKLEQLAEHMITTSSNLATNLLIDLIGIEEANVILKELGIEGIELHRGVEDEKAFDAGISNKVTANGLLKVFRLIEDRSLFSPEASQKMLDILHKQEFKSFIPAGLPSEARVAHKTGEISTIAHDAGLVFLPERKPYAVVILTEWDADKGGRSDALAKVSRAIYQAVNAQSDILKPMTEEVVALDATQALEEQAVDAAPTEGESK